ncbi:hypothetical protein [Streptomyces glomeratus]|uniref:Uncharacterized protein n=1 Tax=Streptomyces glomeratus TaxID=284452 RepID=A0ABP6M1J7_9ACTN|nr:hypothetical protein [Streptomyces glomeratus]MCF1512419.1 hypothetical protein [Streptomyces glomeratus]
MEQLRQLLDQFVSGVDLPRVWHATPRIGPFAKAMAGWTAALRLSAACVALCLPVAAVVVYFFLQ